MEESSDNKKQTSEFIGILSDIQERLHILSNHVDDHFGVQETEVNWGHVGSAKHVLENLNEILHFLNIYKKIEKRTTRIPKKCTI